MKARKLLFILALFLIAIYSYMFLPENGSEEQNIETLREQHISHLKNSPFKATKGLSKEDRKALGVPPNAYYEQMWELSMDPRTGRPMPERLFQVQQRLKNEENNLRGVGGDGNNPWIERGPNLINLAVTSPSQGRTRAIMFDPNDVGAGNGEDAGIGLTGWRVLVGSRCFTGRF